MKELTNYQRACNYLVKIFKAVNAEYFNNELETPTITIQSTRKAYGHVTTSKIWSDGNHKTYELNICADYMTRPIEEVVATMIHEAVHLYCMQNNIKDTSNHGVYHNKRFKSIATNKGHLIIGRHKTYGWTITSPSENTINFCIANGFEDIHIGRNTEYVMMIPKTTKPSSTRKYICPVCGNSFRATKQLNTICGDCLVHYVLAS